MTLLAVIQARMGSSRLPGKVMADLGGKPVIDHVVARLRRCRSLGGIVLATSDNPLDDPLAAHVRDLGIPVVRGPEDDVLARFALAVAGTDATAIARITADCPFIEPALVDAVAERYAKGDADYACNTLSRKYPDGLDVEIFSRAALEEAVRHAKDPFLRMHVTPYIHGRRRGQYPCGDFRVVEIAPEADYGHLRWTIDEPRDLDFCRRVVAELGADFAWHDLIALLTRKPELLAVNAAIPTNAGAERDRQRLSGGQRSYRRSEQAFSRALETVPLASQTFSKSHYQWPTGAAPLFLDRSHGGRTWDIDGNGFIDYLLGLLPIVLGHCDPDVDAAVTAQLARGVTFSLPTLLECELAERIVRLVPCAQKVRFGKNGSDATTAAVRLARAFTGRKRIAVAGYHGWHDWYIGTTTRDLGVPEEVKALSATFRYNDADTLAALLKAHPNEFAAIVLEPAGTVPPAPGFLEEVRRLADHHGVVLVFDEIITGFRIALGGAQAHYGVTPDLACFGKAMGNGMPISAIAGRADIMDVMEDVFISGTFGGEALSLAASIATIDKLERDGVPERLWALGERTRAAFSAAAQAHGLSGILSMQGDGWWPRIAVTKPPVDGLLMTSLLRQEFLAQGLLLAAGLNLCLAHDTPEIERETAAGFDGAFAAIRSALDRPDPASALRGKPVRLVFSVR